MKKIGLKTGVILFVMVLAVRGATLLDTDFSGSSGPLAGNNGWIGRDTAIQLDGKGMAGLVKGSDGFVKHPLTVPANAQRIRLSAKVKFAALPESAMRNHHMVGKEQPAWIALGATDNPSEKAGLSASKLAVSVSSDGKQISIGLSKTIGAAEPAFGVAQASGDGSCELALDYDFSSGTATALLNGAPVLTGKVQLTAKDFSFTGVQLRRIASGGGIDSIKVECTGGDTVAAPPPAPVLKPELPYGSRINKETVRAKEIEARIDKAKTAAETVTALKTGWENPPSTYRTHTRWWWPGNAVTKEGIDFQLQEMKDKGFGGVEIMSFIDVYTKGNINFNSDEFVAMTKYAVDKARALGMEVTPALTPGWNHGHALVTDSDGSKVMTYCESDVDGGSLTLKLADMKPRAEAAVYEKNGRRKLDALIAVALKSDANLDTTRRVDLTAQVSGSKGLGQVSDKPDLQVNAELPAGRWRLLAFWTVVTGHKCAAESSTPASVIVDHLNRDAVERYLKNAGDRFAAAMGGDYGQTVDSFFGDSWEIPQGFMLWSDGLFERFKKEKGYDLRPYLPMLMYGGAPETPYVRYDVGHFLHLVGMDSMVRPLAEDAKARNVGMRQQPHYRFSADIIEQSGVFQRPETENTKRSFDPMLWHKMTASGAWLYPSEGRKWVSCEAFTFINEKYRTTMEEIKRGTDLFLRDGITQFYNHGYFYTPEKELAPSRDLLWMNRISHVNTWWPWYRGLADYQARAAYLSRQGRPECDVLVYAPYPTMWSDRADYPVTHVRDLPFGPLPKILVANGYDFDCVNDDLLLNHAQIKDGKIVINGFDYSVLVLPRAMTLSPETLEKIASFVKSGGTVMALNKLPEISTGMNNREANDARLAGLREEIFSTEGAKEVGKGKTWVFPAFDGLEYLTRWSPGSIEWQPTAPLSPAQAEFVKVLRSQLTPDFEIAGKPQSDGLTFRHTTIGTVDCWFLCNLQPNASKTEVTLNTKGKVPQTWDAMTGAVRPLENYRFAEDGRIVLPVDLQPWGSIFVLLTPAGSSPVPAIGKNKDRVPEQSVELSDVWNVSFAGLGNFSTNLTMVKLTDWTKIKVVENFSGSATYGMEFDLKPELINRKSAMFLDLGKVHEVASVRVNGQEAGKVWMQPYRVDISKQVKAGKNRLEITVANLLWNYAAGLEQPTPVPVELQEHYGTGDNSRYAAWDNFQKQKKRQSRTPSGLLGPVTIEHLQP